MGLHRIGLLVSMAGLLLSGCGGAATPSAPAVPVAASVTPEPPAETVLREAFRVADPFDRRDAVLLATGQLLRTAALRQAEDAVASSYLTDISFSSGQLTLQDPALVRYHDDLAVFAAPEGLGLYLYDLSRPASELPTELTRWTVGITSLAVVWGEGAAGVTYYTQPRPDAAMVAHFLLATRGDAGWQVRWISDDAPDWWLAAQGGQLAVSPDLERLQLTGPGAGTTDAFYETGDAPRRVFEVDWARAANLYQPVPPPEGFESRSAWLWSLAVPSPYATLVEFIERAQRGDLDGAGRLTASDDVLDAAFDYGLTLPERRFEVVEIEPTRIVFRDVQGTLAADFTAPGGGDRWLITTLAPLGSPNDAATPTP